MKRVYVLGDSISLHYGPYLEEYLRGLLHYARKGEEDERRLGMENPGGANGGDSAHVLAFLRAAAAAGGIETDLLLVNCGLHDLKTDPARGAKQVPLDEYRRNLTEIVQVVRGMGPRLVWIRTTPCDEAVHNALSKTFFRFSADCRAYNETADRLMSDAGVPVIDLFGFTLRLGENERGDQRAGLYCDHVHFHQHIRKQQAAFIAGWLAGYLRLPPASK